MDSPPKRLGHYEILARIGAGGMGVVYRARDTRLGREVALKLVNAASDGQARDRLLREARLASRLNHPSICTTYDADVADGETYVAMELVEGQSLRDQIPEGGLPVDSIIRYGAQIADALGYAHEQGVVHRDLKSANVMITPQGRAKVLDFGLARLLPTSEGETETREAPAGTLSHMSPEVLRGRQAEAAADIWALGVMLYQMASGRLPFAGATSFEVTSAILREEPSPLAGEVPAWLRAIVERCLRKEPGERYQRAGEIRAALETMQVQDVRPARVNRRWLLWPATAAIAGPAGYFLLTRWQRRNTLSRGGKPSRIAEANEYYEKAIMLSKVDWDLDRFRGMLEKALAIDPSFTEARAEYGFTHLIMIDSGRSNDVAWIYRAEQDLQRALQEDPECGRAHSSLAAVHLFRGRRDLALAEARRGLEINPADVDGYVWQAYYYWLGGDYVEAERAVRAGLAQDPLHWSPRQVLGEVVRMRGDTATALAELRKALDTDPKNLYVLASQAMVHLDRGEMPQARQALERLVPRDRTGYYARLCEAVLLATESRRDDAIRLLDAATLKYAGIHPLATLWAAEAYALMGDRPAAVEWVERAVQAGDERAEWFRRNPRLRPLQDDPRFRQVLASVELRRRSR